ncbi:MAG: Hsp20/alpha crystallin family protein [Methanoregula sp.]
MNKVPEDMFREMDTFAAHLFSRMARDFDTGFLPGYDHYVVIRSEDFEPSRFREPEEIPSYVEPEPKPEVHRIDNEIREIAGLPGAIRESVRLTLEGNELFIDADGGSRHYHTVAALPPVEPGSMQSTIKNGVLEVRFSTPAVSSEDNCSQ